MPIGVTEEHEALHDAARRWVAARCGPEVPRAYAEGEASGLPKFWDDLVAQGWTGLHLSERHGGAGYGLLEAACVLEELGRALAPGPLLATILASVLVERFGSDEQRAELLPRFASGESIGGVALAHGDVHVSRSDGGFRLRGSARPVLSADTADVLVVGGAEDVDGHEVWLVVDAQGVGTTTYDSLDPTRPVGGADFDGVEVPEARVLDGVTRQEVTDRALLLFAAEAAGVAGWCLDTAVEYAKVREQFGRPIGQFQAVKHRCADMLVRAEQARALAWDAAGAADESNGAAQAHLQRPGDEQAALAANIAGAVAIEHAFRNAEHCIQILGGIGFTWEHDAHLYLRRAASVRQLVDAPRAARARAAALALGGTRRQLELELPQQEAAPFREEVRAFVERVRDLDEDGQHRELADAGYLVAEMPEPWGRGAGAIEQLVIEAELRDAGIRRPSLAIGQWVIPTLLTYGTPEQQDRYIRPTLHGDIAWCQLFSEPGAGSDLASLQTKAVRVDGGWRLTGQKVWTSLAQQADLAICLARTNPDAPKHDGITYFIVDMQNDGVDVRPLRELTGEAMFNEVFLTDVFVPDDQVVGDVDSGWRVARNTLAHERVAMASGTTFGGSVEGLLRFLESRPERDDPRIRDELAILLGDGLSVGLLSHRTTLRQLAGADPGPGASVRKLLGVEHDQRVSEFALSLLGPDGAITDGDGGRWSRAYLLNRCLTIAGGTSEIQRNVIGERLLGLPRDPEPST
ncbi:MAG: acyl-CoA dehydrogenase [Actinobacteria bacterium]|nr:acyl-CoA dehydrogenase [Actinomycetota bacterium]